MEGFIMIVSLGIAGPIAAVSAYVAQARWWLASPGFLILIAGTVWAGLLVADDTAWLWGAVPWWLSTVALFIHASASHRDQRRETQVARGICPECGHPNRTASRYCPECGK
jgi:hypothetical protein